MKVGIVVPYSWSYWGGVPEHADHQARGLLELGHEARILIGNDPPGRLTKALHPRVGRHGQPPEYVLPVGRSVIVPANGSLPNLVLSPAALFRMQRIFAEERFDVVHVHEPLAPVISAFACAYAPHPLVTTSHAAGEHMRWYPIGKVAWGIIARRIDHRIAVSEGARRTAEPFVGGPMEIIPNGVPLPAEADPDDRLRHVVFIGRADSRKGLDVLLRAWPDIRRRTGMRLRVLGADPLQARWLMRRNGVSGEGVDLLGSVSVETRTDELLAARVLVAPSLGGESFGLILLEAFACATPVVASDIEGYRDVVPRETGVLIPPGDAGALATAVSELVEDEGRRRTLGVAGRRLAERRYSWTRIVGRLVEIYEALTGARRTAAVAAR